MDRKLIGKRRPPGEVSGRPAQGAVGVFIGSKGEQRMMPVRAGLLAMRSPGEAHQVVIGAGKQW